MRIYRAWINQPSTFDVLHNLHGKYCIAHDTNERSIRLYFTEGPIHSMESLRECITEVKLSSAEN